MDKKILAILVVAIMVVAGVGAYCFMPHGEKIGINDLAKSGNYLKIIDNASGDYLLNDDDVKIIQDYVDGKIEVGDLKIVKESDNQTEYYLADANCDGKVDATDITVLKGIINRSGQYMNLIDTFGHLCKVPLKIDRVACDYFATAELLNMVGAQDKIVGATKALIVLKDYYLQGVPDMSKVVNFNSRTAPDYEALEVADPQVWVVSEDYAPKYNGNTSAVVVGLDTLVFDFDNILASSPIMSALLIGYMFDKVDKSIEYVNWYLKTWNMLNDKTANLEKKDRPTVFYTGYGGNMTMTTDGTSTTTETATKTLRYFPSNTVCWQAVKLAGGYNLIDDYPTVLDKPKRPTSNVNMDLEWLSTQKWDYTFVHCTKYQGGSGNMSPTVPNHGYICDDPSEYRKAQDTLTNITVLKNACDGKNMYLTPGDFMNGASGGLLSAIMVATVIHADLFPNLDLNKEFQTFIDMMGFNYDLSKHGVFFLYNE